jgi:glycosyltransferase involved in cell wall biosynthesis
MPHTQARVSVVIPTRGRPDLLRRALASVQQQTVPWWEAIVVVDGRDPMTESFLEEQTDPRIRFVVNERSLGGAEARNVGVRAATGEWIALLDDDDEWMPDRIGRQFVDLPNDHHGMVIGFCRLIVRAPHGEYLWPRRPPAPGEHISDYLFARRSLFAGEGGIHTSTIMAPRSLFDRIPFDAALPRYQDTDWVLRASAAGATLRYCDAPLSIWHTEEDRPSIAKAHARDWQYANDWIRARRNLVTPRAYASFLLIRGGDLTAAALSPRGALVMAMEAVRRGRPSLIGLLLFAGKWAMPPAARRRLRAQFSRQRRAAKN